jgi:hypothetical protein
LILLRFQRHFHRFRRSMDAAVRRQAITLRVNHLECD